MPLAWVQLHILHGSGDTFRGSTQQIQPLARKASLGRDWKVGLGAENSGCLASGLPEHVAGILGNFAQVFIVVMRDLHPKS